MTVSFAWLLVLFSCINLALSAESSSTSSAEEQSATSSTSHYTQLVWVTPVPGGPGVQSPYYQRFATFWTSIASPKSGSIGLGSIQGTLNTDGVSRSNDVVSNNATELYDDARSNIGSGGLGYPSFLPTNSMGSPISQGGSLLVKRDLDQMEVANMTIGLASSATPIEANDGAALEAGASPRPNAALPMATLPPSNPIVS